MVNADVQTVFPEFTWREVAGATNYVITITPLGGTPTSNTTSTPRFISNVALEVGADYSWTVEPRNAVGPGPAATPRLFRVIDDILPAAPRYEALHGSFSNGVTVRSDMGVVAWSGRSTFQVSDHSEVELLYADGAHWAGEFVSGVAVGGTGFCVGRCLRLP